MFEEIKSNISREKEIIQRLKQVDSIVATNPTAQKVQADSKKSLLRQLKMLNDSLAPLLKNVSVVKNLQPSEIKKEPEVVNVGYSAPSTGEKKYVTLNKESKKEFLKELQISDAGFKKLSKKEVVQNESSANFRRNLAMISNRFFRGLSDKLASQFNDLSEDLKMGNVKFLLTTYLSIALFCSVSLFVISFIPILIWVIMDPTKLIYLIVPFALAVVCFFVFYIYPSSERGSIKKNITRELPFVTIYMAAIAGSNIEPMKIFDIISRSEEYPYVGAELRKLLNLTNFMGYDLVSSLRIVAQQVPNDAFAELLNGLATNIVSGGELKNYLQKKADNFLIDYRLDRQKATDIAGTFMDIYIAILIAAPLVLMMLFIVMNVAGLNLGLGLNALLLMSIGAVIFANIIFIAILKVKQPPV